MPIPLEGERTPGLPVVKRTDLGEKFYGAIVKFDPRDRMKRDENTKQMVPMLKDNGKAKQELVVICLALPGTTAPAGLGDEESVPEEGALVRLILKGRAFGDWIEQSKALRKDLGRGVQVGDVVTQITDKAQVYDAQGNPSGPETSDRETVAAARSRGRSVGIYGPVTLRAPKEGSPWVGKAEAAYHSLHEPISAGDDGGYAQEPPDDDEPPF